MITTLNNNDLNFLREVVNSIQTERNYIDPVEYIQSVRYLPKELTPKPGYVDYNSTCAYFKEPLFELSPLSRTREVGLMKGVQIMATTSLLEAITAYYIGSCPRPQAYASAKGDLVEKNFEVKIERLIDNCGLRHLIRPQVMGKTRKTGNSAIKKDYPGGFLHGLSLQVVQKSMSYPCLWIDEIDEAPAEIKGQGDTIELIVNRTLVPYGESIAKILYLSTPTTTQTSRIYLIFSEGDQRKYFMPCPRCGELISFEWHIPDDKTKSGLKGGIVFDVLESGSLDYGTVFYRCQQCGKLISNDEKAIMLPEGIWIPQAEAKRERLKTYHANALYSPVGIFSWTGAVDIFLKCWDVKNNRVIDMLKYRSFRNNIQGLPFEEKGEGIKYETIVSHRREGFLKNNIPNRIINSETGSPLLIMLMSVDVQKNCLYVDIKGYSQGGQSWTIDFRKIEPAKNDQYDCSNINCTAWLELEKIIRDETWISDDNKRYFVRTTAIDSGKWPDTVYDFCSWFGFDVIPIKGQDIIKGGVNFQQMSKSIIEKLSGRPAYIIAVDNFKSRISSIYKTERKSDENGFQPKWTMNFNVDLNDNYFKMFTAESQKAIKNTITNKIVGYKWVSSGENHGFDTAVYNMALLEIIATNLCQLNGLEFLDWDWFWNYCLDGAFYE